MENKVFLVPKRLPAFPGIPMIGGGGGNRTRVRQPSAPRRYMLSSLEFLRLQETANAPMPNPNLFSATCTG